MTLAPTILIADFDETTLEVLKEQRSETDYALLHAKDSAEAFALLERLKSKIDVAVIDLELPNLDGFNLLESLITHDSRPTRIVVVTPIITLPILEKLKDLGVDAVVRKPIPHDEWRTALKAAVVPRESASAVGAG